MQNTKETGGLGLTDIDGAQIGLQVKWVQKLITEPKRWNYVYEFLIPSLNDVIWECNLSEHDVGKINLRESHWKNELYQWTRVHFHNPTNTAEVRKQVLWLNSHIRMQGKVVMYNVKFENVMNVEDILDEKNNFLKFEELKLKIPTASWLW